MLSQRPALRSSLIVGFAISTAVLATTFAIYLSGEPSSGRMLGAQAAAFLLATVGGVPLSLVLAPLAQNLPSAFAWIAIVAMPILNAALCGFLLERVTGLRRGPVDS